MRFVFVSLGSCEGKAKLSRFCSLQEMARDLNVILSSRRQSPFFVLKWILGLPTGALVQCIVAGDNWCLEVCKAHCSAWLVLMLMPPLISQVRWGASLAFTSLAVCLGSYPTGAFVTLLLHCCAYMTWKSFLKCYATSLPPVGESQLPCALQTWGYWPVSPGFH